MTNQASRGIQGAVENLIDIAHMQRESMDAGFAKLTAAQTELTHTVTQLGEKIDRLTDRADKIDEQLLTLSQNVNANQVIVASLVSLAEKQQATVDKLLAKVG